MKKLKLICICLFTALASCGIAWANSTVHPNASFAWDANSGWIELRPSAAHGVVVTATYLYGYAWHPNIGWIFLGNGNPANGYRYSNSGNDHGVNLAVDGTLSGFAWSANAGWVNFSWTSPASLNRPRIRLTDGAFQGYAWAPNLGWIALGTGKLQTSEVLMLDEDGNGIPDAYEFQYFTKPGLIDPEDDSDGDGIPDALEWLTGTDPHDPLSRFDVRSIQLQNETGKLSVEFDSVPWRRYVLETSSELGPKELWLPASDAHMGTSGSSTSSLTALEPHANRTFVRVRVDIPLVNP